MKIFKDKMSGDEMFSDNFKIELIDDVVYKLQGRLTTEGGAQQYDTGANASEEAPEEELDENSVSGVNIVLIHRLVSFPLKKKAFKEAMGTYMKNLKSKLEEENCPDIDKFKSGCAGFVKKVLAEFDDYEFYVGEKMDPDGMIALCKWEGEIPYMYFYKHGLDEEKV